MTAGIGKRRLAAAIAGGGLALALFSTALGGPIGDKAAEAERLLLGHDAAGALKAFDSANEAFSYASPLQFRVATFADGITGFGKYTPRPTSAFHASDTVSVYLEPVGYDFAQAGDTYSVSFNAGLEIRKGDLILGKTDNLGAFGWQGRTKSREVHAAVSVTLPSLTPGTYELVLTLSDTTSGKAATAALPFSIVE